MNLNTYNEFNETLKKIKKGYKKIIKKCDLSKQEEYLQLLNISIKRGRPLNYNFECPYNCTRKHPYNSAKKQIEIFPNENKFDEDAKHKTPKFLSRIKTILKIIFFA